MRDAPNLSDAPLRSLRFWGSALFFFSGLTGLVYEILWTRRLNLTFGHGILAVSTVVTAYMGGLALGSALGGRWSDRRIAQGESAAWFLATYGKLEGLVGLWAFFSLPLLGWVESLYLNMSTRGWQGLPLYLLAFFASLAVLLPPTTAMGATLPVVSSLFNSDPGRLGRNLSRLYASNTLGAVCGVGLSGFLLLPILGLRASMAIAGVLNLLIALLSIRVSTSLTGHLEKTQVDAAAQSGDGRAWILLVGFGCSGLLSMAAQMAWTRSLSLSLGSSIYAFSIILVVFLSGIGVGSALYHRWLGNRQAEWRHLAGLSAGIGLSSALVIPVLGYLPLLFLHGFPLVRDHYWQVMLLSLALCSLILTVPTLLMGLSFPLVTQLYHDHRGQLGRSVGNIYSSNTVGCILGSSLTGFVLIPHIGVQRTLELAACGCLWVAAVYARQSSSRHWRKASLALIPTGLMCLALPSWDSALLSAGVAGHGALLRGSDRSFLPHKPVYHRDGLSGTVSVLIWDAGGLTMRVNGKPEASLGIPDRINQTLLGLLPLFYCQQPSRVGIIGLGSGLTLTAIASCPDVQEADCAELEPYVMEGERYFSPYNEQILRDPRVKARYADGRTMIMGASRKYDALVSVPSNPWVAGVGNLYTQDFYRSVRTKLNPGGVLVQWVNLYALSPRDLQTVVQTFGSVFPDSQLWLLGGDLALVGGQSQASLGVIDRYYERSPYLRRELAELGFLNPQQLLGAYACPLPFALQDQAPVVLNTDDKPCLEYSAPRSMYRLDSYATNVAWVYSLRRRFRQLPPGIQATPALDLSASLGSLAYTQLQRAREPLQSVPGWDGLASLFGDRSQDPGRRRRRQAWLKQFPNWPAARMWLAQDCRLHGTIDEIMDCIPNDLSEAAMPNGTERYFWYLMRSRCRLVEKKWAEALNDYMELSKIRAFCDFDSAMALCHAKLGQWTAAATLSAKALELNPYNPRTLFVRALVALHQGQQELALQGLEQVTVECPFIQDAWLLRASLLVKMGRATEAKAVIEDYLIFYPHDKQLRELSRQLRRR